MNHRFEHAYALVIGMDNLRGPTFSNLQTKGEANAQALHTVLVGEDRCAYKLKNVINIIGEEATRQNIVNGFLQLEEKLRKDPNPEKTALIYFSGYEIKNPENTAPLYLIPYDVEQELGRFFSSALNINMLSGLIQSLSPSQLLFMSDSQNLIITEEEVISRPIPDPPPPPEDEDDGSTGSKPIPDPPPPPEDEDDGSTGSKPIPNPAAALGQTLLFSTTGDEHSLVLHDKGISTFTWHLLEALSGYSDFAHDGRTMVTAHEVWSYISEQVPATAELLGQTQNPVSFSNGIDFPVGLLMGGRGLAGQAPLRPLVGQADPNHQSRSNTVSPFPNEVSLHPEGKVYALLIGVDRYDYLGGSLNLKGCVRDSEEVERYLKESIKDPQDNLFIKKLRSLRIGHSHNVIAPQIECAEDGPVEKATRANILEAFEQFLTQATSNDTVFIHFSGHGSFEFRPSELHHIGGADNVDHKGGVIVVQDSFIDVAGERIYPISDLELRHLLSKIAEKGPHIISAMDCCFAGGSTRHAPDSRINIRFSEPPEVALEESANRTRPLHSYCFFEEGMTDISLPQAAKAVSLQACREHELSKEGPFLEGRYGVFTYYFLQVLRATKGNISYRDLIKLIRARVMAKANVSFQSPQVDATDFADIDLGFLSTEVREEANHFTVRPTSEKEGWMDAGTLHGIATISAGETHVDIFPADFDFDGTEEAVPLSAKLIQVEAHASRLALSNEQSFPADTTFMKAIITASPIPPTKVRFAAERKVAESDEFEDIPLQTLAMTSDTDELQNAIALLRTAIGSPSIQLVSEAAANEGFQFNIVARVDGADQSFEIRRRDDTAAMAAVNLPFSSGSADTVIGQMEHITRWEKTLKLENEHPSKIQAGEVEILAFDAGKIRASELNDFSDEEEIPPAGGDNSDQPIPIPTPNGELIRECRILSNGKREVPRIKLRVRMKNADSNKVYHAALVAITSDFQLATKGWLPPSALLGKKAAEEEGANAAGQVFWNVQTGDWVDDDNFFFDPNGEWQTTELFIREDQIAAGVTEIEDHFKLIISTEQFDPFYLEQAPIDLHVGTKNPHQRPTENQLEEFLREAGGGTRAIRRKKSDSGSKVTDWWSTTLTIRTKLVREE